MRTKKRVIRNETTPPQPTSIAVAVIVSTLLCMGFPWMVGSAFRLNVEVVGLLFSSLFMSGVYAAIFYANNKKLTIATLIATPFLVALIIFWDVLLAWTGLETILHSVQYYAIYSLPKIFKRTPLGLQAVTATFEVLNLIHICYVTHAVIRRKNVWVPVILFAPYLGVSLSNMVMVPSQGSVVTAAAGTILLLLTGTVRNKERKAADRGILILSAPVILLTIILGLIFPMKSYDKNKLAEKTLVDLSNVLVGLDNSTDGKLSSFMDVLIHGRGNPNFNPTIDSVANNYAQLYASSTDLAHTGPFNPPSVRLFSVFKATNIYYTGDADLYSGSYLYLKLDSMDIYEDNLWSMATIPMDPYSHAYTPRIVPAQYTITITTYKESSVDIMPIYTDYFVVGGTGNTYSTVNPYNYSEEGQTTFFASPVPLRTGNLYSPEYINEYVYDIALEVPDETREAILNSGVLPDWYLDAYYGNSDMTDAEKVIAVTDFVRELHPYNRNTQYPPDGSDFVVWFLTDADTGICVHYASTSVILLRMLGIPARYVDGFMESGTGLGCTGEVFSTEAHSWFEFFDPEFGWIMGDATPGNENAAAHFDINAVIDTYPEAAYDVFSINPFEIPDEPEDTTATTAPEDTSGTDAAAPSDTDTTETTDATAEASETSDTDVTTTTSETSEITQAATTSEDDPDITESEPKPGEAQEEEADVEEEKHDLEIPWDKIKDTAIAALIVFIGFGILRIIYVISWRSRFAVKDNRKKAVAYYHYFSFTSKLLGTKLPRKAVSVAEKAAFSNEPVSDEDIKFLVRTCSESAKALSDKLPAIRRVPYRFFEIKV